MTEKNVYEYCVYLNDRFWSRRLDRWREECEWWASETGEPCKFCHDAGLLAGHVLSELEHFFKHGIMSHVYDSYDECLGCRCFRCYRGKKRLRKTIKPTECHTFLTMSGEIACGDLAKPLYDPRDPASYVSDLFDNYYNSRRLEWKRMWSRYRELKKPSPACIHDFIHLGLDIYSALNEHKKFGMLTGYYDENRKYHCCSCAPWKERNRICSYTNVTKPGGFGDVVCWREVNLTTKDEWRGIPKTGGVFHEDVDTLNKKRSELEKN